MINVRGCNVEVKRLTSVHGDIMFIDQDCCSSVFRLFLVSLLPSIVVCRNTSFHPQKQLANHLIGNYGPMSVRPVWNQENTITTVLFELRIAQIVEFDERKQQITVNGWMRQMWKDDFLSWDPSNYEGITSLTLTGDEIWFPDTTLYENIDPGFLHTSPLAVTYVNSSGMVSWATPVIIQSSCRVKVRYFPFDTQTCKMTFGSWTMDGSKISMKVSRQQDNARERVFYDNGVWSFESFEGTEISKNFTCCENPFHFVEFQLNLTRQSDFYLINVLVPCCMLCLVNLMVFWMPAQSGEKMAFVVSNLLAAILFQQLVGSIMPPLGDEVPVLSLFFLLQITLSCLIIVGTTLVLRVYHNQERPNKTIPPWLYQLTLRLYYWGERPLLKLRFGHAAADSQDSDNDIRTHGNQSEDDGDTVNAAHRSSNAKSDQPEVTWREVSIILDRLLFVIALVITVFITVFVSVAYTV